MIEFFPVPLLVGLIPLVVILPVLIRQERRPVYIAGASLFYLYLLLALGEVIFPIPPVERSRWMSPDLLRGPGINLIPFYFGPHTVGFGKQIAISCLLNVLLTTPFGFAIGFFRPHKARDLLWLAPATGLGLEFAQLLACLAAGTLYRSIDINDSIFNAAGVVIGYGLFHLFARGNSLPGERKP